MALTGTLFESTSGRAEVIQVAVADGAPGLSPGSCPEWAPLERAVQLPSQSDPVYATGRGWIQLVDDQATLTVYPEPGSRGFRLRNVPPTEAGTRYDVEGWVLGNTFVVTQVNASHRERLVTLDQVPDLVWVSDEAGRRMLEQAEAQPWFSQIIVGGTSAYDATTRRHRGFLLHVLCLTRDALQWAGAHPSGSILLWPVLSTDRQSPIP